MRDYRKGAMRRPRASAGFSGWTGLAIGLGIGLVVATGVWQYKSRPPADQTVAKQKKPPASQVDEPVERPSHDPGIEIDFAKVLPKTEVIIPEKEKDAHHDVHAPAVTRPGTSYLQAGSFRSEAEADRVRDELTARGVVVEDTGAGAVWRRA